MTLTAVLLAALILFRPVIPAEDSMAPSFNRGDLGWTTVVSPHEVQIGDTILRPTGPGRSGWIAQRISTIKALDGTVTFATKGDANISEDAEQWAPTGDVRVVAGVVPKVGNVVLAFKSFRAWNYLAVGLLLLLALDWKPRVPVSSA